jgi:hypothetical protein
MYGIFVLMQLTCKCVRKIKELHLVESLPKPVSRTQIPATQELKKMQWSWYCKWNRKLKQFHSNNLCSHPSRINCQQLWLPSARSVMSTGQQEGQTVVWHAKFEPIIRIQLEFRRWLVWEHLIVRALCDGTNSLGRLTVWKRDILLGDLGDLTYQAGFRKEFGEVISRASEELQVLQTTCHRILWKSLRLKPHKLQHLMKSLVGSLRHTHEHRFWNTCTLMSEVVLPSQMRQKLRSLQVSTGMTLLFKAVSVPEDMRRIVCADAWKRLPIFFFWWGRHYKQFIPRQLSRSYSPAAQQTTILFFKWKVSLFFLLTLSVTV